MWQSSRDSAAFSKSSFHGVRGKSQIIMTEKEVSSPLLKLGEIVIYIYLVKT